jgi:predicted SAM-dependent methyltransferase
MKRIFKKYKDVCLVLGILAMLLLLYVYVQNAWVSGPWPETTPQERAYSMKMQEEYQKEQQRLKDIE